LKKNQEIANHFQKETTQKKTIVNQGGGDLHNFFLYI